ncbi:MAG: P13 family porin [Spirochaetia bacterium]|nr:P13 family porin [Spirochaetia bacterium]
MKKISVTFLFLFILMRTEGLFADSDTMIEVDNLIKYGRTYNKNLIIKKSQDLSSNEKNFLLEKNKIEAGIPVGLNLFLGLGIGSYVQGDTLGGIVGTLSDLFGVGAMFASTAFMSPRYNSVIPASLILSGLGILAFSKVYQIVRPFTFANMKNAELGNMLFSSNKISFLFIPYHRNLNFYDLQEDGAVAGFSLRF